jgi:hypothetical protein
VRPSSTVRRIACASVATRRFGRFLLLVDLEIGDALVVALVEIGAERDAGLDAGVADGVEDRPVEALFLHPPFAAGAVVFAVAGVVVLMGEEIGADIVPAPAGEAHLPPAVVILALSALVEHTVDRGAAAEQFAAGVEDGAAVEARLRRGLVAPIGAGISNAIKIADRNMHPVVVLGLAGLQQQNGRRGVCAEPVGQQAAGGAGADDDVVVCPEILVRAHAAESAWGGVARQAEI